MLAQWLLAAFSSRLLVFWGHLVSLLIGVPEYVKLKRTCSKQYACLGAPLNIFEAKNSPVRRPDGV